MDLRNWDIMSRTKLAAGALTAFTIAALSGVAVGPEIRFAVIGVAYLALGFVVAHPKDVRTSLIRGAVVVLPWLLLGGGVVLAYKSRQFYPLVFVAPLGVAAGVSIRVGIRAQRGSITWLALAACVVTLMLFGLVGMPNWLAYTLYEGRVRFPAPAFAFVTADGRVVTPESARGRVLVLDFWTTYCGVCFQKFPELERLYTRYRYTEDVEVYAVNLPFGEDQPGRARELIERYGYAFPVLYAESPYREVSHAFQFEGVPTAAVVDREGVVRYLGGLDTAPHIFINNLWREVERARAGGD